MSPNPVIVFRVDASIRMGTGHTVRCLTLADELRRRGATVHFVQRLHPGHMVDVIRNRGFEVHTLTEPVNDQQALADADYRGWAGVSEEEDAAECIPILRAVGAEIVVLDHYGFGAVWHCAVRGSTRRLMVIDDLANRRLECDMLLDQNYFDEPEERYNGLIPDDCVRMLGPQYALLAPEYAKAREFVGQREGAVARVLVFMGGSDPYDCTGLALRALSQPEFEYLAVDVVVGRNYGHRDSLEALADVRGRVKIWDSLRSLLPLMMRADLAIGAGGSTTWERCCVGLPSIVVAIAKNQRSISEALGRAGACVSLPFPDDTSAGRMTLARGLAQALSGLVSDQATVSSGSEAGMRLGDGMGASCVAEMLLPSPVEKLFLRRAVPADASLYWRWANDPLVRASAYNPKPIPWTLHLQWFSERLNSSESVLWVLCAPRGVPLGQFRVDVQGSAGIIDYSIDRPFRGRGLGRLLLSKAVFAWKESRPDVPLRAEVRSGNSKSASAFRSSGLFNEQVLAEESRGGAYTFTVTPHRS